MNLTVLSLSLSSIYSISPLNIGNNNHFYKLSFHNYYSPTFILNPEKLIIEKSIFSHGIGSIIHSNNIGNSIKESTPNYINASFTNSNLVDLNPPDVKSLIVVRDCSFINIQYANHDDGKSDNKIDNYMIKISRSITFYMTNCLFDSCYFNKSTLFLKSRATTISHICCNNLHGGQDGKALFLESDTPGGSFFKLIYSTFYGKYQHFLTKGIFYLAGTCALRYQCINTSNFILSDSGDRSITRIQATACLTMQMNTFYHLDSEYVLWINIHDGASDQRYNHYCGLNNFYDNKQQEGIIYFDMQENTRITIDECYFSDTKVNDGEKMKNINGNAKIYISNCYFKTWLNGNDLQGSEIVNIHENINNFQTMTLAHYTLLNKCDATYVIDAFGCQNDTCPDKKGCQTFGFTDEDVTYTEVFHPDINTPTPTPTERFTESLLFSNSLKFSPSKQFSSKDFTKSSKFSPSHYFTPSGSFSRSHSFTASHQFSKSSMFSKSSSFSHSEKFSQSKSFSLSHSFTGSQKFTGSHSFTLSSNFTESGCFSKSKQFSSSFYFTKTGEFSQTEKFSNSKDFSETKMFTESQDFTKSFIFSPSFDFNASHTFTPSNPFTKSDEFNQSFFFSKSSFFSTSNEFTGSSFFSESDEFPETKKFTFSLNFTESNKFTFSKQFSQSFYFSQSKGFTESKHFDATGTFTPSHIFSLSDAFNASSHFTNSFYFTESKKFTPSKHFDATGTFTASDHFTPSNEFTKSDCFTSSDTFTNSDEFTQSLTFSKSSVFTYSKSFSPSNTILKNVNIIIKETQNKNKWKIIGGVIAAVGGAALVAAVVVAILLRHRHLEQSSDMFVELNTIDDPHSSITYNNVLHGLDMGDDPFQDDFDDGDYHHFS